MNRIDRLLLQLPDRGAWLSHLDGIGEVTLNQAVKQGYVTSAKAYNSGKPEAYVHLTDTGKAKRKELRYLEKTATQNQHRRHTERLGRCIRCGNHVELYCDRCRCSSVGCPLHTELVTEAYWLALRAAVEQVEQEAEERVEWAEQHGNHCRCIECHVP